MGGCQVEQGRLSTPRQGLASGTLVMRIDRDRVDEAEPVQRISESPALSGVEITRLWRPVRRGIARVGQRRRAGRASRHGE
ncbi:hypothetical protein ACM26W_18360 [Halomonas sp. HK25]|uniref:hypothetical protein n=1 Tax=Halomonas sp. HK25 TaxID=3394321 RepID=UPI0039FD310F